MATDSALSAWLRGKIEERFGKKWTLRQVEKFTGIPRSSISAYLAGTATPGRQRLYEFEEIFGTPAAEVRALIEEQERERHPIRKAEELAREFLLARERERLAGTPILVPFLENVTVSAGPGGEPEGVAYLPSPYARKHEFVAVRVVGDCMEPEIQPGFIVIVDKTQEPKTGEIVAALCQGETIVKRLTSEGGRWMLVADRPGYTPIPVDQKVEILGVVRFVGKQL